jgi:hypothetical protein
VSSEADLLAICKADQGAWVPAHHGIGSFATTYSHRFVAAAHALYSMYRKQEGSTSMALVELSKKFKASGIRSCRGGEMTLSRVEYLHEQHLRKYTPPRP